MSMKDTIQNALDDIGSPSASSNRRSRALAVLEQQLALACAPDVEDDTMPHFLELQDTFECNIPTRTLCWIQTTVSRVDALAGRATSDTNRERELNMICSHLHQLLSLIQGIVLHHAASKVFLGRQYPLEILVALLTSSRHTPMITPSFTGNSGDQSPDKTGSIVHLSSAVLDTLLCVLVDSSAALRVFEDVKGVQAVVKLLKRAGTPREVRMKCLEFLYFYLMDETTTPDGAGPPVLGMQSTPSTPLTTQVHAPTRQAGSRIFARPASGTSSLSLGWSSSSSSTSGSAFSMAINSSQSNVSSIRTPSPMKKSYSTPVIVTDMQIPPNSPPLGRDDTKRMLRAVSPHPMMMLGKDVDYEPQSPKKANGSWVYVEGNSTASGEEMERREGCVRTTEEKKELLGTLLGNVDALVEGVRKAGIWGLT